MASEQSVERVFFLDKPVVVQSRRQRISGDAGLLPIPSSTGDGGYTRRLAALLKERRRVPDHSCQQMVAQRVYGILAGYDDCNVHDILRDKPIHPRADADFGAPVMMDRCEHERLTYTFGLRSNDRLERMARPLMDRAVRGYERSGEKQRLFTYFAYQADSWPHPRTVVAAGGTDLRFVIANLPVADAEQAERTYDDYIQRGASEQRMDELKKGLSADRLRCHRFQANFLLLLHTAEM